MFHVKWKSDCTPAHWGPATGSQSRTQPQPCTFQTALRRLFPCCCWPSRASLTWPCRPWAVLLFQGLPTGYSFCSEHSLLGSLMVCSLICLITFFHVTFLVRPSLTPLFFLASYCLPSDRIQSSLGGDWFQPTPTPSTKIHGCASPLYKMVGYLHVTYTHFESCLDYLTIPNTRLMLYKELPALQIKVLVLGTFWIVFSRIFSICVRLNLCMWSLRIWRTD